jgi:hypothetical protein
MRATDLADMAISSFGADVRFAASVPREGMTERHIVRVIGRLRACVAPWSRLSYR